ncbi:2-C-methyl-D-erythritol 4-phosphate cytidylyltransferase [Dysgonomonas sp. PFB1-18]|uniref:2-C-methyl-D-erythritol 4-phosphate cytidylyltransferase n=1 Tax=unclassified Dysgonomonas TaxID=2630389 RepID=UPI0024743C13|nr:MULTISPECIES: 2-C-methyl-D-erythritol 4-phosphate cytidylyltransferase [unclassified Dysgonomonas]MDH6307377.1 2-C-methyl-D-erythritol 4-phosphate cytidylyltransferase [Dysgonomonas sp. PF1-14]MDH6337295.1 2-C-methyl-D-erythritol 4-phosphate cytidylyltransferase [Dysgonomonas sp. PF1-16]MDH6379219.1 2-C-methyl-D-erythritol 4-phosphate cytidylyltransferase [Dysgonomonas sp. PFB1-18]MDH6396143.1 2-C-methyl-D-erythritol 4-phosphate cytidylyltransferase [Dysgonomonas sp. PF1-23]
MKNNVIIVAGGKGLRMGSDLPKQFIPIGGKPVLMRTVEAFYNYDKAINIILVLPLSHQDYWKTLCAEYNFDIAHTIATGGETRFHSVKNGLAIVAEGIVAVQDGVRPFASEGMIGRCFDAVREYQAVIPVIDSTDSLREMLDEAHSRIIDRSKIRLVQTPQVFDVDVLKKAYETEYKDTFTDDASVVEAMGINIHLVKGEVTNIKITTPLDLKIGELLV